MVICFYFLFQFIFKIYFIDYATTVVPFFLHFITTHKQTEPFWCWFPGGWVCVHSGTLWVSLRNFPVRLGVSPATTTSTGFFCQRFWGFISLHRNSGLCSLSCSPVVPPGYPHTNVGPSALPRLLCQPPLLPWSSSHCLASSPFRPGLPVSASPPLYPSWSGWMFL